MSRARLAFTSEQHNSAATSKGAFACETKRTISSFNQLCDFPVAASLSHLQNQTHLDLKKLEHFWRPFNPLLKLIEECFGWVFQISNCRKGIFTLIFVWITRLTSFEKPSRRSLTLNVTYLGVDISCCSGMWMLEAKLAYLRYSTQVQIVSKHTVRMTCFLPLLVKSVPKTSRAPCLVKVWGAGIQERRPGAAGSALGQEQSLAVQEVRQGQPAHPALWPHQQPQRTGQQEGVKAEAGYWCLRIFLYFFFFPCICSPAML